LADAVTVVGDNVESKLKTATVPEPIAVLFVDPHGSPTAAVDPFPESATDVPNATEFGGVVSWDPDDHEAPPKV